MKASRTTTDTRQVIGLQPLTPDEPRFLRRTSVIDTSSGTCTTLCVDPDRIDEIWPHVLPFIETALSDGNGDENAEIVLADLRARGALLWIVWAHEQEIIAAATTKLTQDGNVKTCVVTTCSGRNPERWSQSIADIEAYAKAEGCNQLRILSAPVREI